jgi:hypothetical protein
MILRFESRFPHSDTCDFIHPCAFDCRSVGVISVVSGKSAFCKKEDKNRSVPVDCKSYCRITRQTIPFKEIDMFIKKYIAQFRQFARSRTIIGIVGAVAANLAIAATVEHLTSVAALSLG